MERRQLVEVLGAHPPVVLSRLNPPYAPFYRSLGWIRLLGGIESLPPPRLITRPKIAPYLYLHRETKEARGKIENSLDRSGLVCTRTSRRRNERHSWPKRSRPINEHREQPIRPLGAYTPLSSPENRSSRRLGSLLAGEGGGGRIILARLP